MKAKIDFSIKKYRMSLDKCCKDMKLQHFFIIYLLRYFMIKFFSESVRELRHVVWPTYNETRKYFLIVLTILVLFWLYLFLASTFFSEIIFSVRDMLEGNSSNIINNIDTNVDLNVIENPIGEVDVNTIEAIDTTWGIETTDTLENIDTIEDTDS